MHDDKNNNFEALRKMYLNWCTPFSDVRAIPFEILIFFCVFSLQILHILGQIYPDNGIEAKQHLTSITLFWIFKNYTETH